MAQVKVKEKKRTVVFMGGEKVIFHNVVWFDNSGTYLRLMTDEGYVLINTDKVLCHIVDGNLVR